MLIPKSFNLFGHTITVEYQSDLYFESDSLGRTDYRTYRIILQPSLETYPISQELQEQIFVHEVLHWIFFFLGENNLRENENLIDLIANMLVQVDRSSIILYNGNI